MAFRPTYNTVIPPAFGGNGISASAEMIGGTNAFLPATNRSPANPIQLTKTKHYTAVGGGNFRIGFANWEVGSTGEILNAAGMIGWYHGAMIEYNGQVYPVTFNNGRYGYTAVGDYVISDIVPGLHVGGNSFYYIFHVCIPYNYLSGHGTPPPTLGVNGDFYYDNVNLVYYGPKTSGAWGASSPTNPWLSQGYIVPATYATGAFNEFCYEAIDATLDYLDGSFPRDMKLTMPDIASGTLTFSGIGLANGGKNYGWEPGPQNMVILDLSAIGPQGSFGTQAAGYGNVQSGNVYSLTATTASGSTYKGPLAIGFGNDTEAWGPALISMVPDMQVPWMVMLGDSIVAGAGADDGFGEMYRQFGIYQRMLSYPGWQPPAYSSLNWGVPGLIATALDTNMAQSRAMFAEMFPLGGSNVFIAAGTNDFAGQSANGYLPTVKTAIQNVMNYWKNTLGFRHGGVATILPRTTSTDSWATTTNQTPINVTFSASGDVDTFNGEVTANTLISNQDWYVDMRSWTQDATLTHAWKVSGAWTQSANATTFPPTGDGIHPSVALMVYSSTQNAFPSLLN